MDRSIVMEGTFPGLEIPLHRAVGAKVGAIGKL